jgi:site-specific recombinase XerD
MRQVHLKLGKVRIGGKEYFRLTIPKIGGGRQFRVFKDEWQAKNAFRAATKWVRKQDYGALSLDPVVRDRYLEADRLVRQYGGDVLVIVREWVAAKERQERSVPVKDAFSQFMRVRVADGKSKRYLDDLKSRLGRFVHSFPEFLISQITSAQLTEWLQSLPGSLRSRNNYQGCLKTFFEFAQTRGWCTSNPVTGIGKAKVPKTDVGILTPNQADMLLRAASKETLPYWVIALFCGVRSAELARLTWANVKWDSKLVEVGSRQSKTASRRLIELRPNAFLWLAPYQGSEGKIYPERLKQQLILDKRNAGIKHWPNNACRHSFASYLLELTHDAARVSLDLGHSKANTIFSNYRELVTPFDAQRYWSLVPTVGDSRLVK